MFRKSLIMMMVLLLAAAAFTGSAQADGTPTPDHRMDMGEGDHGDRTAANGASVRIIAPQHTAVLDQDSVIVRVETINWPLGEGKHWHLYVNGKEPRLDRFSTDRWHTLHPTSDRAGENRGALRWVG